MTRPEPRSDLLPFVGTLSETHARISGDIVQVEATTWAVHGVIAYDGEVLLAEFDTPSAARHALHHLPVDADRNESTT